MGLPVANQEVSSILYQLSVMGVDEFFVSMFIVVVP
jgi:hypothetical protein